MCVGSPPAPTGQLFDTQRRSQVPWDSWYVPFCSLLQTEEGNCKRLFHQGHVKHDFRDLTTDVPRRDAARAWLREKNVQLYRLELLKGCGAAEHRRRPSAVLVAKSRESGVKRPSKGTSSKKPRPGKRRGKPGKCEDTPDEKDGSATEAAFLNVRPTGVWCGIDMRMGRRWTSTSRGTCSNLPTHPS